MKELILYKPKELINIEGAEFSRMDLLLFNYILYLTQNEEDNIIRIGISNFTKDLIGNNQHDAFRKSIEDLSRKKIKIGNKETDLLKYEVEDHIYTIELPKEIYSLLIKNNGNFIKVCLKNQKSQINKYAQLLYEFLKSKHHNEVLIIDLTELRKILGVEDRYLEFSRFKLNVLIKAFKYVNDSLLKENQLPYKYEGIKLCRRVTKLKIEKVKPVKSTQKPETIDANTVATLKREANEYMIQTVKNLMLVSIMKMSIPQSAKTELSNKLKKLKTPIEIYNFKRAMEGE